MCTLYMYMHMHTKYRVVPFLLSTHTYIRTGIMYLWVHVNKINIFELSGFNG